MASPYFEFKQFRVWHNACAMKVGTDAVVLGLSVEQDYAVKQVLDIGTGSGVIALILAQRNLEAQIDAIELDEAACKQAAANFAQSPWRSRLEASHTSLQLFAQSTSILPLPLHGKESNNLPLPAPELNNFLLESHAQQLGSSALHLQNKNGVKQYDCIVSNPPFFEAKRNFSIKNQQRSKARHDADLPFDALAFWVAHLLKPSGKFWLILPVQEAASFNLHASNKGLHLCREIAVVPLPGKPVKRLIQAYQKSATVLVRTELILQNADGKPSADYIEMSKEFYLRIDL
ncbi:MAG: methyltransferase [bacterium]|nr:methyltransferase [bacterium]